MRILQIIDSLDAGGAEQMAVSYANELVDKVPFTGIVATRREGSLVHQLDSRVSYLFLNKKNKLDFGALFRLRSFVLKNRVTHIHAHSSSFFLAFILKISLPCLKVIWHNHYGNSENLSKKRVFVFKIIIPFFNGVIVVSHNLKRWVMHNLEIKNVIYIGNFSSKASNLASLTFLKGLEKKRILLLANLRGDKNHFLVLEVAKALKITHPDWSFHLIGKDFDDAYSSNIKATIKLFNLVETVFVYGTKDDIDNILNQASIAILTSKSEGLPLALLEYGMHKKPCVLTSVGEIPEIIQNGKNGFIVDPTQTDMFYTQLVLLIENENLRLQMGEELFKTITENFSPDRTINNYLKWLKTL